MDGDDNSSMPERAEEPPVKADPDMFGSKPSNSRMSRKRTKTGCLTCRRRRIKCGEERPRCGNCIKSKRQCEGYNQRVIFKDPLSALRFPSSSATVNPPLRNQATPNFHASSSQVQFQQSQPPSQPPISQQSTIPRPRNISGSQRPADAAEQYGTQSQSKGNAERDSYPPASGLNQKFSHTSSFVNEKTPQVNLGGGAPSMRASDSIYDSNASKELEFRRETGMDHSLRSQSLNDQWSSDARTTSEPSLQGQEFYSDKRDGALTTKSWDEDTKWPIRQEHEYATYPQSSSSQRVPTTGDFSSYSGWLPDAEEPSKFVEPKEHHVYETPTFSNRQRTSYVWRTEPDGGPPAGNDYELIEQMVIDENENDDDDPYDVTDDELEEPAENLDPKNGEAQQNHLRNNDLGIVVALQAAQDRQDQSLRTYHSFIEGYGPDVLATYRPSGRSSPLSDSMTARIFCHFINVTAPCISMYERHPANPSLIFQGRPVPKSQQHIWAYTMPTIALSNPALLHAMLALGSLHMAKLQGGSITAPLKHYHLAIRRVAKAVGLPTRRSQPATLAATMLLGWFEVMCADHSKWAGHVLGAKLLLQGIDFGGMTRYLKIRKMQLRHSRQDYQSNQDNVPSVLDSSYHNHRESSQYLPKDDDVNENLISMIMGKRLQYDQYGQILEDVDGHAGDIKTYTQREIETYEIQRDLFWWFCKQDSTQSFLGGTKLLMPYDLWSLCPPRAAVGRRDATYGTWDHLLLLLGRLAEFSAKDLKRKRSVMKASPKGFTGGAPGVPPSQMAGARPFAQTGQSSPPTDKMQPSGTLRSGMLSGGMPPMPTFAGMLPGVTGKVAVPRGFTPPREDSPDSTDDRTIEEQTREAEEEWQEIHSAFNMLEDNFGPDFQALGPEYSQPIQTPFGPALQYRTFGIAGIWMSYYMGLIVLHRAHPSMPPVAMVAVGVAARQTSFYANEIGRIAARIAPNATQIQQVNTGIGAALIESSFPLFVAGVQYQDSAQRTWTIQRCFDMRRLTGWQTAHSIAIGCETSWIKAAEFGQGPPYTRGPEWKTPTSTALDLDSRRAQILSARENGPPAENFTTDTRNRVHYAMGLLAVEEDLGNLKIQDEEEDG